MTEAQKQELAGARARVMAAQAGKPRSVNPDLVQKQQVTTLSTGKQMEFKNLLAAG
jgi:hypothetical protein